MMRNLPRLLALVTAVAVLIAINTDSSGSTTKKTVRKTAAKTTSLPFTAGTGTAAAGYTSGGVLPGGRAGSVAVATSGTSLVLRLDATRAVATPTALTLQGTSAFLVATTGAGRRSTSEFVASWAADALAGPLSAVVVTQDGVRHSVALSAPSLTGSTLTLHWTGTSTVPVTLAHESGVSGAGGVAGLSGTLAAPTVYISIAAARVVQGCTLTPGTVCDGMNLAQQSLEKADLANASLQRVNLWQAGLRGATLTGANISGIGGYRSDLTSVSGRNLVARGANLTQASIASADLRGADLRTAVLRRADASYADLAGADLSRIKASGLFGRRVNLSYADLSKAELIGADLTGADLRGADLHGANLAGANLIGADLTGADLSGANLNGAVVRRASFSGVTWSSTKCPDGIRRSTSCT